MTPRPLVATSGDALARLLWGNAWARWFAAHPEWRVAAPVIEAAAVTFTVTGPPGAVVLRLAHPSLDVSAPVPPASPAVYRELATRTQALVARGLRWEKKSSGQRLELFIASGCNLHCSFCCESERIQQKSYMPWEEIEAQLQRAAARGVSVIQFMGGEATLHPRFPDALRRAKELGMGTFVITNLLRWEQRAFAEAVAPWLDEVMVSVHAVGAELGGRVTGRRQWWEHFQVAAQNAQETLRARVRCATVLQRDNAAELETIAGVVLGFRPHAWVMGAAVPVPAARDDVVASALRLSELAAMRPRFEALAERTREAGCKLVFFCIPHCVLGPTLWDDSHDLFLGDQDLSDEAPADAASITFWSQADYLTEPRAVTLARSRPDACRGCARRDVCGGYFTDYLARFGADGIRAVEG